ncbi:PREDICTED: splicing factor, proline- and glutamine-rich-like [Vollenhovia emeryi]|uniref:splicing factor, proline- and glutamine-rich-like n=1 Tax=Vollenhovia emeryi TaxID=411798 RepID=UPI0005F4C9C7|nr:PREDICTED: splicing factor, proline- and glutamine-rich-like [Vollenhovia emeryi]
MGRGIWSPVSRRHAEPRTKHAAASTRVRRSRTAGPFSPCCTGGLGPPARPLSFPLPMLAACACTPCVGPTDAGPTTRPRSPPPPRGRSGAPGPPPSRNLKRRVSFGGTYGTRSYTRSGTRLGGGPTLGGPAPETR